MATMRNIAYSFYFNYFILSSLKNSILFISLSISNILSSLKNFSFIYIFFYFKSYFCILYFIFHISYLISHISYCISHISYLISHIPFLISHFSYFILYILCYQVFLSLKKILGQLHFLWQFHTSPKVATFIPALSSTLCICIHVCKYSYFVKAVTFYIHTPPPCK